MCVLAASPSWESRAASRKRRVSVASSEPLAGGGAGRLHSLLPERNGACAGRFAKGLCGASEEERLAPCRLCLRKPAERLQEKSDVDPIAELDRHAEAGPEAVSRDGIAAPFQGDHSEAGMQETGQLRVARLLCQLETLAGAVLAFIEIAREEAFRLVGPYEEIIRRPGSFRRKAKRKKKH